MRNEALIGYLLHQRPYQEKRALYYLFSQQHGVVHGVGKKGAPLFMPLQLFATGKRDLKTFSQIQITSQTADQMVTLPTGSLFSPLKASTYDSISGHHQYAALYLNEILWRLLPTEDPTPLLWQHYQDSLQQLKCPLNSNELRLCLRQFEQHLFNELGFNLILTHDNVEDTIDPDCIYRFLPDVGLLSTIQSATGSEPLDVTTDQAIFKGIDLIEMASLGITDATLHNWSKLHRHLIDHLLDYQPLQSRLLWQQQQRYQ